MASKFRDGLGRVIADHHFENGYWSPSKSLVPFDFLSGPFGNVLIPCRRPKLPARLS